MLCLVIFVGSNLLILVVLPVVMVAFDPPVEIVAWSLASFIGLSAVVLAVILGRRTRADLERARQDPGQTANGSG